MPMKFRRVVTGHDAQGRSVILMDGESPHGFSVEKAGGLQLTELWETTSSPADNSGDADAADHERRIEPPGSGTVFRYIEYPPDSVRLKTIRPEEYYPSMGVAHGGERAKSAHPGMHRTNTIDYAIIIKGEIYAVMDEGEVLLRPGDCLIQRGTSHAWSNRTNEPCVIAFVLVAAKPLS